MAVKGFNVTFRTGVKVEIDESVFTQEKRDEFRKHFYQFDTNPAKELADHAEHVAQLVVRDMIQSDFTERSESRKSKRDAFFTKRFLEGYGFVVKGDESPDELTATSREWSGIRYRFDDTDFETEIEETWTV